MVQKWKFYHQTVFWLILMTKISYSYFIHFFVTIMVLVLQNEALSRRSLIDVTFLLHEKCKCVSVLIFLFFFFIKPWAKHLSMVDMHMLLLLKVCQAIIEKKFGFGWGVLWECSRGFVPSQVTENQSFSFRSRTRFRFDYGTIECRSWQYPKVIKHSWLYDYVCLSDCHAGLEIISFLAEASSSLQCWSLVNSHYSAMPLFIPEIGAGFFCKPN